MLVSFTPWSLSSESNWGHKITAFVSRKPYSKSLESWLDLPRGPGPILGQTGIIKSQMFCFIYYRYIYVVHW